MGTDKMRPVLVGVGQLIQRTAHPSEGLDPLAMLCEVARRAAEDAGGGAALLRRLDTVCLVDTPGWHPQNAPGLLSEALGASASTQIVTPTGGESGLTLVNLAAGRIAAGEASVAFVGGVNALKTLMAARKAGIRLPWPKGGQGRPERLAEARQGESALEMKHGLRMPIEFYPLCENALRARLGRDLESHRDALGQLFSPFTKVAADNPFAWFPVERSAQELVQVSPDNRMVAYPYTKFLNAVLETDQAAGVLMMSEERARALGLSAERFVHWLGGAYAEERAWFVSERPDISRSPALQACAARVLAAGGVESEDIELVDFYSCFPVAVELACEAYGIAGDDPRGLTVTGGLPYAGGPANNYTTHAVAAMVERLRQQPGLGLCTGNGWYLTKHTATLLASGEHAARGAAPAVVPNPPPKAVGEAPLPVQPEPAGAGRVEAYTVTYDRAGEPERGIVVGRLDSGQRFIANTPGDRALLSELAQRELCGQRGVVETHGGLGRFRF